jgi:two-component system sensor histidine kinase KdpD
MATSLHAELIALYVETPASIRMSASDRERLAAHMRLAESLGGEPITVRGENAALETVRYARKRNVTKIVVGKPTHPRWRDFVVPSFLDDIVRQSPEIDVYVISGLGEEAKTGPAREAPAKPSPPPLRPYIWSGVVTGVASAVSWVVFGRSELADVVMIHLLGVVVVAMRFGYGASLVATVLSVFAVDVFFVPPYLSFAVTDVRHIATFVVMFVVAVVISHLTKRVRDQADSARERELRTASLYAISRELGLAQSRLELLEAAARHLREVFAAHVAVFLRGRDETPEVALADPDTVAPDDKDLGVVEWVWAHQRAAGLGTDTLPAARALVVPLKGSKGRVGVLALFPTDMSRLDDPDDRQLLETFAGLVGSAIERTELADEARRARLRAETEHLRNALLSSVSHDLRTPLGVITGATSVLLDESAQPDEATKRDLLQTAHDEAERLTRLVRNLLDMTRLEAGALKIKKAPESVEELVGSALGRTADRLRGRAIETDVPSDLLVPSDSALMEQVLINLLENATKYTPADSAIVVAARKHDSSVEIDVSDRGPGVPSQDAERVFDKFYRAREGEGGGVGLGLTISRGIVEAHGGKICVLDRPGGGATFRIRLPA